MTLSFDGIRAQRQAAHAAILTLIWTLVPILAALCWAQGTGGWEAVAAGAVLAGLATACRFALGATALGRSFIGVALMGQVSLMVADGGSWQVDLHMAYFAALAVLVAYSDWIAILAAAVTVAVHHLALSYAVPSAVFPGSAGLDRVALHAVILTVEAATLIWVTANLNSMFALSARSLTLAENAAREARASASAAERAQGDRIAAQDRAAAAQVETRTDERSLVVGSIGTAITVLTQGDLTYRIVQELPGEYGKLRDDFNAAMSQLQNTIMLLARSSDTIRSGAGEISANADDFTKRAEQQAASLEETAAALGEITATVRQTAEGAEHARDVVGTTKREAEQSGQVVREAIAAMGGIEASSGRIGQIVGTIDEIAFQTNLLALNAGVEAARAGEAGRGFAVVASEVRTLAQRSAEAAKEIRTLIAASAQQVDRGVELVGRTGQVLDRIVAQVSDINTVVVEIASSAREQAAGLAEINTAVTQMDEIMQRNTAMVGDNTAASHVLNKETEDLARLIMHFKAGHEARVPTARPAREAAAPGPRKSGAAVVALRAAGNAGRKAAAVGSDAGGWTEF